MKTFLQHTAWKIGLALLILLLAQMRGEGTQTASADMSPPPAPTGAGFYPVGETTNVRMMSEYVLLDIAGYSDYRGGQANVTAEFVMRNLGDVAEQMQARFPLTYSLFNRAHWDRHPDDIPADELCQYEDYYPPLSEFQVWVNDENVDHTTYYEVDTIRDDESGDYVDVTFPCWENFNVTFPPGQDVYIKISYVLPGYNGYRGVEFDYVLETGAGWRDTIGQATIVARLPYEINTENMYWCWPNDCTVSGTDVTWRFEDFEPDFNIAIDITKPETWLAILTESNNVQQNPDDGEAWGRLGKAYKEITYSLATYPDFEDAETLKWFDLSFEAYSHAVTLLPNDADWHFGFAELMCYRAMWGYTKDKAWWYPCLEQIKLTLDINPEHVSANNFLEACKAGMAPNDVIRFNESTPVYLILTQGSPPDTPQPYRTPTPTITMTGTPPTSTPTSTRTLTRTAVPTRGQIDTATPWYTWTPTAKPSKTLTSTPSATPEPQNSPTAIPTSLPAPLATPAPASSSAPLFIGAGVLLVILVVVIVVVKGRRG